MPDDCGAAEFDPAPVVGHDDDKACDSVLAKLSSSLTTILSFSPDCAN